MISIYFDRRGDESYSITAATMLRRTAPRFELDEAKARAFLHRALRRYDGSLPDGEGDGASRDEDWTLKSGWDIDNIFSDELSHVEDLVHQAIHVVGAITLTAEPRPRGSTGRPSPAASAGWPGCWRRSPPRSQEP